MQDVKLTEKQRTALEWLQEHGPWEAAWWGGKPHSGFPKEMPGSTYEALRRRKWVRTVHGPRFDMKVSLTSLGEAVLKANKTETAE